MQDKIEQEVTVRASMERVFTAIIDPVQLVAWFPDTVEGELKEGAQPIFGFGEGYGHYTVDIIKVQPYDYFSYRWVQTIDPNGFVGDVHSQPNTLVEFHLRDEGGATVVKVTETGFATLPEEVAKKKFADNSAGWEHIMNLLVGYAEK